MRRGSKATTREFPRAVPLPSESRISSVYAQTSLADAYSIELPEGTVRDPEVLARFIFSHQPGWVATLMAVRDTVVSAFGLKTGRSLRSLGESQHRIGIFKLYETSSSEVLVGEDDKHLNFRASVLYRESSGPTSKATVVLSTVVHCHNLLGRTYIALIAPFHRRVVQAFLRRAAQIGWPREDSPSSSQASGIGV
jgi:uncharacterized protein DUF2867